MSRRECNVCLSKSYNVVPFCSKITVEDIELPINEMFDQMVSRPKSIKHSNSCDLLHFICTICVSSLKQAFTFKLLCYISATKKNSRNTRVQRLPMRIAPGRPVRTLTKLSVVLPKQFQMNGSLLKCNTCNRSFKNATLLMQHLIAHHSRCFQCDTCPKNFTTRYQLDIHKRLHYGIEYICLTCGKGFTSTSVLDLHSRSRNGVKSYICSVCNKGCVRVMPLSVHMHNDQAGPKLNWIRKTG